MYKDIQKYKEIKLQLKEQSKNYIEIKGNIKEIDNNSNIKEYKGICICIKILTFWKD